MLTFSTLLPSPPPSFSESQISQSQELLLFLDVPAHVRSPVAMATHDPYLDSMMTTSLGSRLPTQRRRGICYSCIQKAIIG